MRAAALTTVNQRPSRPTVPTPEAADVLGGLERVLASGDVDGSPRSRAFMRFIVEETLAGRQDGLSQAAIAVKGRLLKLPELQARVVDGLA